MHIKRMRAYKTPALPPEINTLKSTNSALLKNTFHNLVGTKTIWIAVAKVWFNPLFIGVYSIDKV